ncbi:PaaI family thioesterase [Actinomycetospora termitidis]|uniref:PaaI family thioesterase n=1 Tax=Actinomycetospora termitidis TaxID=3053470 RepID=A0ABT7MCQ3_9PSEU|nr:PaaI family thioesterase [Actinomycetospora sp. Odt1-22]MDL5158440.1 PaaI family thioesterase [Actinomycetospora sp. Odt1-22]
MATLLAGDALLARAEAALAVALPDALGVEFVDPSDPLAGVVLEVAGIGVTPAATLHGSALAAVCELAGYLAVLPTLTSAEHAVTHQLSLQYLRGAGVGQRVRVDAELARRTRSVAFVGVTARLEQDGEQDGTVVAQGQITKSIVAF